MFYELIIYCLLLFFGHLAPPLPCLNHQLCKEGKCVGLFCRCMGKYQAGNGRYCRSQKHSKLNVGLITELKVTEFLCRVPFNMWTTVEPPLTATSLQQPGFFVSSRPCANPYTLLLLKPPFNGHLSIQRPDNSAPGWPLWKGSYFS